MNRRHILGLLPAVAALAVTPSRLDAEAKPCDHVRENPTEPQWVMRGGGRAFAFCDKCGQFYPEPTSGARGNHITAAKR